MQCQHRSEDRDIAYEVEVAFDNGQDINVELDANFTVVSVDADGDGDDDDDR